VESAIEKISHISPLSRDIGDMIYQKPYQTRERPLLFLKNEPKFI
jgi:hypothetical protein